MKMKKEILDKIDDNVNYIETKRIKLNVYVNEVIDEESNYLLIGENLQIKINETKRIIRFDEIKGINLSMCSRLYNPGVIESNLGKLVIKQWQRGTFITVGQHINYYLDLDVVLEKETLEFENNNLFNGLTIIESIENHGIAINDPLQIKEILMKYQDPVNLVNYLNNHFPKLAKEYSLDNPRGIVYIK